MSASTRSIFTNVTDSRQQGACHGSLRLCAHGGAGFAEYVRVSKPGEDARRQLIAVSPREFLRLLHGFAARRAFFEQVDIGFDVGIVRILGLRLAKGPLRARVVAA
jgi:hypothetical protein